MLTRSRRTTAAKPSRSSSSSASGATTAVPRSWMRAFRSRPKLSSMGLRVTPSPKAARTTTGTRPSSSGAVEASLAVATGPSAGAPASAMGAELAAAGLATASGAASSAESSAVSSAVRGVVNAVCAVSIVLSRAFRWPFRSAPRG